MTVTSAFRSREVRVTLARRVLLEEAVRTEGRLGWVAGRMEGGPVGASSDDVYRHTSAGKENRAGQQLLQGRGADRGVGSSWRVLVL